MATSKEKQAPTLGKYTLLKKVSEDAWGTIYEALKTQDNSPILLRAITPSLSNNENFLIRFDLLKTILPTITHKNLLKIESLDCSNNIYYIAKEFPAKTFLELKTFAELDCRDIPNRHQILERFFQEIAEGLAALEQVNKSYYRNGIILDNLEAHRIYIASEKALIGKQTIPSPKIDGFGESFLFFGENTQATLEQRISPSLHNWKQVRKKELPSKPCLNLYRNEALYSYQARHNLPLNHSYTQYSFGALAYHYFTGVFPKGIFPPIQDLNPTLAPQWENIIDRCLSSPYGKGYANMQEVSEELKKLSKLRTELSPQIRKIEELPVPSGMTLVIFTEKVILGSNDGPSIESPSFKAHIKPFFIDIAPVTCAQFSEFQPLYQKSSYSSSDQHPATLVTYHMARAYCQWRSRQEGLPDDTYRLPSEYEWEAAVRGSTGEQYPWRKKTLSQDLLHCDYPESLGSFPVKQLPPGRFGIYDMLGNVWEWTSSLFRAHPFSKHQEKGYSSNLYTVKGGCWYSSSKACRASLRAAFRPTERRGNLGFRCVRSIEITDKQASQENPAS